MENDPVDLYRRASDWTLENVAAASRKLDAATPCDEWDVRTLLNHMLETQRYFLQSAQGKQASPPSPQPPQLVSSDPVKDFERVRSDTIETFSQDGVIERTGPAIGIAFADTLLHGWDLAKATGIDTTMPEGLAEAAYATIHGRFTDEQRRGVFKPELPVPANASAQERLLAYTGRKS